MEPRKFLDFLEILEKLKCNTRHSWTSSGRRESVAEHSYRLMAMAFLLKKEFPETDMNRVLEMCLVHDWGEAVTGDIPSFYKTGDDESKEEQAVNCLLKQLPPDTAKRISALFDEVREQKTEEAKIFAALDKLEAVIQHNEADISTWLPLERELNPIYGEEQAESIPYLREVRRLAKEDSLQKVREDENQQS